MLKKQDIKVGKIYVNEGIRAMREVVAEMNHHMVQFNAFDLNTGNLLSTPHQSCHAGRLARWADRAATPAEISRLRPYKQQLRLDEPSNHPDGRTELEIARAGIDQRAGNYSPPRW